MFCNVAYETLVSFYSFKVENFFAENRPEDEQEYRGNVQDKR